MSEAYQETVKVALFGDNSTGKTLQIRSLIETFGEDNVGIVSCEHGLNTIASSIENVKRREPTNLVEFKEAWRWARECYPGRDKWVCVDGGTRVLQWIAGDIWAGSDAAFIATVTGVKQGEMDANVKPFLRYITQQGNIDSQKQWIDIGRAIDFELNRWAKLTSSIYWTFWRDMTSRGAHDKGLPWQTDAPGKGGRDAIYGTFDFILQLTRDGDRIIATHDQTGRVVRSKARDDWNGGVKIPGEMPDFHLGEFVKLITPRAAEAVKEVA